ncbi:transaldolase [Arenibacter sp. GZD96]|uniref:hypothetical protein n=1 Tax=Aurantibrevibacter litoralis TaxID=3106030 RepID=UPI002AFE1C78|nr:hypothetical protein [Arenibacter sp. GZD-96]MEA1787368.1 transaldolase [Arenibacter sp. GZD-96]
MIRTIYFLLCLIFLGCSVLEKGPNRVFFAGEIVNPTDRHIVLYKNDKTLDSVALNEDNMFFFQMNNIDEGLYHFNHSPELQYVYFEKGDSLVIRLNTLAFDESLIFTGKGAEINNFLLSMFLKDEEEKPFLETLYILEPEDFGKKIDSLRNTKYEVLDELLTQVKLSDKAIEVAKASIDYNLYIAKEKYPFYHKKRTGKGTLHELNKGFYEYRKQIPYNNTNLTYFRPYYNFMKYHFGNLSYMTCTTNCGLDSYEVKDKLHYNKHTLELIDSLVVDKDLRDNLFRNVAIDYFLKAKEDMESNQLFIEKFLSLSGNNRHIKEITQLYEGIKNMQPANELPAVGLQDRNHDNIALAELAQNKNVVFYFWSGTQLGHFDKISKTVHELSAKHPDYAFIGLNWNTDPAQWNSLLTKHQLDQTLQYRIIDFNEMAKNLVFDDFNKAIIVKNGRISNGFGNLYSSFK